MIHSSWFIPHGIFFVVIFVIGLHIYDFFIYTKSPVYTGDFVERLNGRLNSKRLQ